MRASHTGRKASPLFEVAPVFVRLDYVARFIVKAVTVATPLSQQPLVPAYEHECRAQSSRSASDDDGVENLRVGRARRVGCDHNGDLKSSTTAQNENQDERAYQGNDQGTDAPEAVGEECEHYP
jgi:hypothetical protein